MGDTLTKIRWADGEKNLLTACILTLAALLISLPLFSTSQILAGYDLPFHLGHIEGLAAGLSSGQFPVRVNPVQLGGYGMPTSIFYPDFFLYPLAFLRLAGISLVTCWNLGLFGINILTVFAAWWAFSLYAQSSRLGAVAALFYLGCLYRMVTMYVGAGISSALAMAFFPAALVSIWVTLRRNAAYWPAVVLFSTGVLLSHIVTSLLLIAVTLLMVLCSLSRFRFKVVRQSSGKAVGFTALLSIWYYAPLLYFHHHMGYLMKSAVSQQGVWDWTIFPLRVCDYYVGSVLILLCALLSVFLLLYRRQVRIQAKSFFTLLLVSVAILLILSHPQPWHILGSLVGVLQFPARLAVFPMTFLSMAAALGLAAVHKAHPIPYPRAIVFCWRFSSMVAIFSGCLDTVTAFRRSRAGRRSTCARCPSRITSHSLISDTAGIRTTWTKRRSSGSSNRLQRRQKRECSRNFKIAYPILRPASQTFDALGLTSSSTIGRAKQTGCSSLSFGTRASGRQTSMARRRSSEKTAMARSASGCRRQLERCMSGMTDCLGSI